MVKYAREPQNAKSAKGRIDDLRTHYKTMHETANAVKGMLLTKAEKYLRAVIEKKQCIPFRRHKAVARCAQAKQFNWTLGRWPEKACRLLLELIQNVKSNAEARHLNMDELYIKHIQVNHARKGRRRTFRAHGRIKDYLATNCHVEMFVVEKEKNVKKAPEPKKVKLSKIQQARKRIQIGKQKKMESKREKKEDKKQ